MSLDKNLYTLLYQRRHDNLGIVDLVEEASQQKIYTKARARTSFYAISLEDSLSGAVLATLEAQSSGAKSKRVQLHNPSLSFEFKQTGTFVFEWSFDWEGERYEWRRESGFGGKTQYICHILRRPDPAVAVAMYRPSRKSRDASFQMLDYNLARFDIHDKKGLEIVLLTTLFSLQDTAWDEGKKDVENEFITSSPTTASNDGLAKGSNMHISHEPNEIIVRPFGEVPEYVARADELFASDKSLLFIILRAHSPDTVPKLVSIAAEVKATRWKARQEELHQYVVPEEMELRRRETVQERKPKRIVLDDPDAKGKSPASAYIPPNSLTIFLSREAMPELEPPSRPASSRPHSHSHSHSHSRDHSASSTPPLPPKDSGSSSSSRSSPPRRNVLKKKQQQQPPPPPPPQYSGYAPALPSRDSHSPSPPPKPQAQTVRPVPAAAPRPPMPMPMPTPGQDMGKDTTTNHAQLNGGYNNILKKLWEGSDRGR